VTSRTLRRLVAPAVVALAVAAGLTVPIGAATAVGNGQRSGVKPPPTTSAQPRHVPVLAYYYIWFDRSSWENKKSDFPQLGRYSSDSVDVMRQHVQWAKQAGIDGFIVSWKHTPTLDARLANLVDIAEQENFKLSIIYQGLDVNRNPLPGGAATVARDLDYFAWTFSPRAPFNMFPKPLVIWSGTWGFSTSDIAGVTASRRGGLTILASERNVDGYNRLAHSVDGNAYYWSSVNPATYQGYRQKLADMRSATEANGGLWIAPAAPGFDARRNQGTSVVPRDDGKTLDEEISAAIGSRPDMVGLISWNEFTENSHIEPSQSYGFRYLDVVAQRLGNGIPIPETTHITGNAPARSSSNTSDGVDSSASSSHGFPTGLVVFPAFLLFFVLVLVFAGRRARRPGGPDGPGGGLWRPGGRRPPALPGSRRARREARRNQRFRPRRPVSEPVSRTHAPGSTSRDGAQPALSSMSSRQRRGRRG
jgi:hypothetical protein